jgi:flagellar biosynthetic protein FliQ
MVDVALITAMKEAFYYAVVGVCILTIPALVVGIVISILQAATQINEMTLTFIPKFLLMFFMLVILGPWMIEKLILITQHYMTNLQLYIG